MERPLTDAGLERAYQQANDCYRERPFQDTLIHLLPAGTIHEYEFDELGRLIESTKIDQTVERIKRDSGASMLSTRLSD